MRQLLALTEGADNVCYRYRVDAFREVLAERNWELRFLPHAHSALGFMRQLPRIAQADVVLLQRRLLDFWKRSLLRRSARILVYDVDDAVFQRDSNTLKPAASRRRWRGFQGMLEAADLTLTGNAFLSEQALRASPRTSLQFVPTVVDHRGYPIAQHSRIGADVQMVWIGSRSTLSSLHEAQPSLAAACRELPGLTLKVVCDVFPNLETVPVHPVMWQRDTEVQEIAEADIGIAWHPDHSWSLGKCGLKVLQYMAAGLPVVANPIGVHCELIEDGVTGFLPRTPDEWSAAIRLLAASSERRQRMGMAGRAKLIQHYSVTTWGPRFATLIEGLVARSTTTPAALLHLRAA